MKDDNREKNMLWTWRELVDEIADDEDLREQLCWAKYKTIKSNGIYLVESKDDIKKRYGRSPDHADSFLMGLWALPKVDIVNQRDKYYRDNRQREYNPMTV